jgi:kynurenine formamidase
VVMRTPHLPALVVVVLLLGGCGSAPASDRVAAPAQSAGGFPTAGGRLIDLSHSFDEKTIYWPTSPSTFELKKLSYGPTPGGFFYAAYSMCSPEHGGTHLDSPIHFAEGKSTTEAVPLSRLIAPAVVIDISKAAEASPDALFQPADIEAFEKQHGAIGAGTIVMIRTGWASRWPDRKAYMGDDTPGDASNLHFPGISEAGARALADRQIAAVGIDTASIDHGPSKNFIAHQVLMGADIPAFENVASMADLPPRGAVIIALPMKIAGGSGGPLRIAAWVPEGP